MIPDFFQSPETTIPFGAWGPVIGIIIVLIGTCVGVEVKMGDDEDVVAVQKEYVRLAEVLYNGTKGLAPRTMEDRDIFELLGFD